jgi:biopolymer transport protein TolR
MYNRRHKKRIIAEINVVPYIDVMLVLLVIFMITAPMLQQGVEVDLPQAKSESLPSQQDEPLVVSVDRNGNFYLNLTDNPSIPIDNPDLLMAKVAAIMRFKPNTSVMVRGDQLVPYGKVVQAMVLLKNAGVPSVGLMTQEFNTN